MKIFYKKITSTFFYHSTFLETSDFYFYATFGSVLYKGYLLEFYISFSNT